MTIRKMWWEKRFSEKLEELKETYNNPNLELLHVDPPLSDSLVQKVAAIKWIGWKDIPEPVDYACIFKVSPTTILVEIGDWICGKDLVKKILEALRQESEVELDTVLPN